jgi:hypothetical protein
MNIFYCHSGGGSSTCHSGKGRNPLLRIPILILLALSPGMARAATLRETLTSALSNYCIPKDENVCEDPELIATYDKGICKCNCLGMIYDTAARQCIDGQSSCPAGQMMAATNAGSCAAGYYLVSDIATSCPAGFMLASTSATSCPTGFKLESTARVCGVGTASASCDAGHYMRI